MCKNRQKLLKGKSYSLSARNPRFSSKCHENNLLLCYYLLQWYIATFKSISNISSTEFSLSKMEHWKKYRMDRTQFQSPAVHALMVFADKMLLNMPETCMRRKNEGKHTTSTAGRCYSGSEMYHSIVGNSICVHMPE